MELMETLFCPVSTFSLWKESEHIIQHYIKTGWSIHLLLVASFTALGTVSPFYGKVLLSSDHDRPTPGPTNPVSLSKTVTKRKKGILIVKMSWHLNMLLILIRLITMQSMLLLHILTVLVLLCLKSITTRK